MKRRNRERSTGSTPSSTPPPPDVILEKEEEESKEESRNLFALLDRNRSGSGEASGSEISFSLKPEEPKLEEPVEVPAAEGPPSSETKEITEEPEHAEQQPILPPESPLPRSPVPESGEPSSTPQKISTPPPILSSPSRVSPILTRQFSPKSSSPILNQQSSPKSASPILTRQSSPKSSSPSAVVGVKRSTPEDPSLDPLPIAKHRNVWSDLCDKARITSPELQDSPERPDQKPQ